MIYILGDIHFSSRKDYLIATCKEFLNWYENWSANNENNILILAGDLVDSHINGGLVIDFLEKFANSSRFSEVHVVVGNHDARYQDSIRQLAYEFYKRKSKFHVYEEATEVTIEGLKCLFLPYYWGTNEYDLTMVEYYSTIYKNKAFSNNYDLAVGHFSGEDVSFAGSVDCVKNLDKIKTKKLCLGHIHTRNVNPERYIGSVYAGRKNENDYTRAAWYYDGKQWKEDKLPIFNEFLTVTYPNSLSESKALIPIYTILCCGNEKLARQKYGDRIFIRKVTSENVDVGVKKRGNNTEFESLKNIDIKELFKDFIKTQDPPLTPEVKIKCEEALKSYLKTSS